MIQRKLSSRHSDTDVHRDYGNTHTMLAQVPDRWDFNTERGKWTCGPTPNKETAFS